MIRMHFVAIGGNLPFGGQESLQLCAAATQRIALLPGVSGLVCSPWYSTAAEPDSSQPRYVNGVSRFAAPFDPAGLLAALQAIEAGLGRVRGAADAARTLDLDIIDAGGEVRDAPDLVLPHPRAHGRAFVLLPLRDVAPAWCHPRLGRSVQDLIAALPPADARRL